MANFFGVSGPTPSPAPTAASPAGAAAVPAGTIKERIDKAKALSDSGRLDEALALYQSVLAEEPRNWSAVAGRGNLYRKQKKFEEAILDLEKAAQANPNEPWYLTELVDAYDDAGNQPKAVEKAREAVRKGSKAALNHCVLGKYHRQQKEWKEAEEELRLAVNLWAGYGYATGELALLYESLEQWGMACLCYREWIRLNPTYAWGLEQLGRIYLWQLERLDDALEICRRGTEVAPNNHLSFQRLSEIYVRRNMTAEALQAAETSVRLAPNESGPHCFLARALKLTGRIDEARREVKKAIELDPKYEYAQSLAKELG